MKARSAGAIGWVAACALVVVALAAAPLARADQPLKAGPLRLSSRLVRASFKGTPNSAAYLVIQNTGDRPDALLAARCACAQMVEIHKSEEMNGMSMMASAAPVVIPPHGQVTFRPNGLHLMLMNVTTPLVDGRDQEITLVFQHAGAVRASFAVRAVIR